MLIVDSDSRGNWLRGVVEEVEKDSWTQQVRAVTIRTGDGTLLRRPSNRVALLRLTKNCDVDTSPLGFQDGKNK